MATKLKISVNGLVHSVSASLDTPLLYVLHNELHLHAPRFGCGLAQCGACSVLLNGKEIRSCVTPAGALGEGTGPEHGRGRPGTAPAAAGLDRRPGSAVRLLPKRNDHPGGRLA